MNKRKKPGKQNAPKNAKVEDKTMSASSTGSGDRGRKRKRGGIDLPDAGDFSYLTEETEHMDRERRELEQQGHRKIARVNAREHAVREAQRAAPEGELQNSILQHPELNGQRFDGIDPNLNPEPPLNTEARREFDNQRREQEMEKQLRLGNMPKMGTAPKPQGP